MGGLVAHKYVPVVQSQLNFRFSAGDQLDEMVAIQKEFSVFSSDHPLESIASILNIGPAEFEERRGWFNYLSNLKFVGSDVKDQNGEQRIISAIADNLQDESPLPVYFTWHLIDELSIVTVTIASAYVYSGETYLIISAPFKKT